MIFQENATLKQKLEIFSDAAKYDVACTSSGTAVVCSLSEPEVMHMDRGMPSLSIKSPISTIGFGLCSLQGPYFLNPLNLKIP